MVLSMSTLSLARTKSLKPAPSWHASLQLDYVRKNRKTIPNHVQHIGPLRVQRPFYPEGNSVCHTYLLHPPGGVVGGDLLSTTVNLANEAHAVLTTPGATKIYRNNLACQIRNQLNLEDNAILEWMPQETLVFSESTSQLATTIHMQPSSQLFFWDVACLGMPAMNTRFEKGCLRQKIKLFVGEDLQLIENNAFAGGSKMLRERWGLQNYYVTSLLIMSASSELNITELREVAQSSKILHGLTQKGNFFVCRALADDAEAIRKMFIELWKVWRKKVLNKDATLPRIWNT